MDLVIRIASHMIVTKQKYIIKYIPISGSWTEGSANLKVLGRQRSRWATGLAQVLVNHRSKLFNYKYKRIGLVVLPNNLFFEFLAPIIEVVGRSEEHTSELQSRGHLVCRLLLEKKKNTNH